MQTNCGPRCAASSAAGRRSRDRLRRPARAHCARGSSPIARSVVFVGQAPDGIVEVGDDDQPRPRRRRARSTSSGSSRKPGSGLALEPLDRRRPGSAPRRPAAHRSGARSAPRRPGAMSAAIASIVGHRRPVGGDDPLGRDAIALADCLAQRRVAVTAGAIDLEVGDGEGQPVKPEMRRLRWSRARSGPAAGTSPSAYSRTASRAAGHAARRLLALPVAAGGNAGEQDREADQAVDRMADDGRRRRPARRRRRTGRSMIGWPGARKPPSVPGSRRRKTNSAAPVSPNQMKSTDTT